MKVNFLFRIMLLAGMAVMAAGCEKDAVEGEYRISADKESVGVGQTVTFTVANANGADVTEDWTISDDSGERDGRTFGWDEAGTYTVTASSKADPNLRTANSVRITVSEVTYTISADKTDVEINEEVTFTVTSSTGEDVTSDWNLCDESACRVGNVFGWSTPGEHTVTAHMKADPSIEAENTITINVTGSTFRLYIGNNDSDSSIEVYTLEQVDFYVRESIDGVEQDGDAYSFEAGIKDGERFSEFGPMSNVFTEAGVYVVDAKRFNFRGEVMATTENTVIVFVKERDITGYEDSYYRRSLLTELTGTSCTSCPSMVAAIEYVGEYLQPDRFVTLALHHVDALNTGLWQSYYMAMNDYDFYSYPVYIIDWNKSYNSTNPNRDEMSLFITASQASYANTPGLAIETTLTSRTLDVTIRTTPRETAEYYLGAYVVEDNIYAEQQGADGGYMTHMNVAYYALTEVDNIEFPEFTGPHYEVGHFGKLDIEPLGTLEANNEYTYDYTLTIPTHEPADHNLDNCRVVYFICKADSSIQPYGYFCANAATVKLGESADYEFEPIYGE